MKQRGFNNSDMERVNKLPLPIDATSLKRAASLFKSRLMFHFRYCRPIPGLTATQYF
jgi:hypothetical protein